MTSVDVETKPEAVVQTAAPDATALEAVEIDVAAPTAKANRSNRLVCAAAGLLVVGVAGATIGVIGVVNLKQDTAKASLASVESSPAFKKQPVALERAAQAAAGPTSDPDTSKAVVTMLAVGDWGSTTGKESGVPGSCCRQYDKAKGIMPPRTKVDFWSQKHIANLMGKSADELKPVRVLGHGDNFYWNGVGKDDVKYRFEETFEKMYNQAGLKGVKWVNVAGNHDIGGSMYICGDKDNAFRECKDTQEMLTYLNGRFDLQAKYKSVDGDRWLMKDHYYVESVTKDGVTVDIFNLDTNHADSHGARQVCCQCYGYSAKLGLDNKKCEGADRGQPTCAGGNGEMFDACMKEISKWADDSLTQATRDIKASKADFKIINTHYSPHFHMNDLKRDAWYKLCKDNNVQVWLNGHTHGFNHDIAEWGTHFFENGGGGGIFTEGSAGAKAPGVNNKWIAAGSPYGFLELSFSKDWLKVQFASFDDKWVFAGEDLAKTVQGGVKRGHCWFVPSTAFTAQGAQGQECKDSFNGAFGPSMAN